MSVRISDIDNAIAARDNLIDDQRRKIDDYKYKYYNAQDEADKANHDLDYINSKFEKLLSDYKNLQHKYDNMKQENKEDRNSFDVYAEKVEHDMKIKIQENKNLKEKLDIARNEIIELQEILEEKDMYITVLEHPKNNAAKFTSETQTSLQEELSNEKNVEKFSKEKKLLVSKFKSLQKKINSQITNISKSIQNLQQKPQIQRCFYGWKCTRKFCKYSHEHLYSYLRNL